MKYYVISLDSFEEIDADGYQVKEGILMFYGPGFFVQGYPLWNVKTFWRNEE